MWHDVFCCGLVMCCCKLLLVNLRLEDKLHKFQYINHQGTWLFYYMEKDELTWLLWYSHTQTRMHAHNHTHMHIHTKVNYFFFFKDIATVHCKTVLSNILRLTCAFLVLLHVWWLKLYLPDWNGLWSIRIQLRTWLEQAPALTDRCWRVLTPHMYSWNSSPPLPRGMESHNTKWLSLHVWMSWKHTAMHNLTTV